MCIIVFFSPATVTFWVVPGGPGSSRNSQPADMCCSMSGFDDRVTSLCLTCACIRQARTIMSEAWWSCMRSTCCSRHVPMLHMLVEWYEFRRSHEHSKNTNLENQFFYKKTPRTQGPKHIKISMFFIKIWLAAVSAAGSAAGPSGQKSG